MRELMREKAARGGEQKEGENNPEITTNQRRSRNSRVVKFNKHTY